MQLTIRSGADAGKTVVVQGHDFTIGRNADCDLVLTDLKVSRRHAAIRVLPDGRTILEDLGSSNGTYVNGHRVQSILLSGSEQVQVGDTVIVPQVSVEVQAEDGATAVKPVPQFAAPPPPPPAGPLPADVHRRQTAHAIPATGGPSPQSDVTRQLPPEPPPPPVPPPPKRADRPSTPSGIQRLMLQRSVKRATYIGTAAIVLAIGLAVALALVVFNKSSNTNPSKAGGGGGLRAAATPSAASAVKKVTPSTVLVVTSEGGGSGGRGTGWVWDAKRGLIVTNAHVTHGGVIFTVNQGSTIDINEDSAGNLLAGPGARRAQLKGEALCEDIAVLQVSNMRGLRTIEQLPPGKPLQIGDPVVAVGYPAAAPIAANPDFNATLTGNTGVVSVPKTTLESVRGDGFETGPYQDVIQTDTVINEGNSGGPLVNFEGQLVGMNTIKSTQNVGQNYAVADERIRQIVPQLIAGKDVCGGG